MMNYKGYAGELVVDLDAGVLRGKVVNTKDTITFQGKTVEEAIQAFQDSVDDYLEFCQSLGEQPEKPFSGKFLVRLRPELHRTISTIAQLRGVSLNSLVETQLSSLAAYAYDCTNVGPVMSIKREADGSKVICQSDGSWDKRALMRPDASSCQTTPQNPQSAKSQSDKKKRTASSK